MNEEASCAELNNSVNEIAATNETLSAHTFVKPSYSGASPTTPLTTASQSLLIEELRRAAKPHASWRCGLEWELIGYTAQELKRLDADQMACVLESFAADEHSCVREEGRIIEVAIEDCGGRLTIEPGGQIEFSGHPQKNLARIMTDGAAFLSRLCMVGEEHGFIFLAVGFDPLRTLAEQQWFPKRRYEIMRPFLERAGTGGADMMTRTAAVQCNLDFANEGDLARKFTLASRLAPIVNAIFANSPFAAGQVSGYKSTRAAVWLKTDGSRTVTFPSTLEEEFSLERFVQDALRVPLVFVRREGSYDARVAGMSFGEYLDGGARRVNLEPCFQDWLDHLSTIFTDARLRPHLELRSADANDLPLTIATQALWRGLLYDADALDAALLIAPRLIVEDMCELSERIARDGLRAEFRGVDVLATAQEIVRLAADGLRRTFPEELRFLDPVQELILEDGMSPADVLLKNWAGAWGRRMEPVIKYLCA